MALNFAELAERRAIVRHRFMEEAKDNQVRSWLLTGNGDIDTIVRAIRNKRDRQALLGHGDIDQIVQTIRERKDRQASVDQQFPELATAIAVRNWVFSGNGDIAQIVQTLRGRDNRRTDSKDKLAGFGLSLREDVRMCDAFIRNDIGSVDEIVVCMRQMEWFFRCTEFTFLRFLDGDDDEDDDDYYHDDDDKYPPPSYYVATRKERLRSLLSRGCAKPFLKMSNRLTTTSKPSMTSLMFLSESLHADINTVVTFVNTIAAANKAPGVPVTVNI
ncbi:hypothetical protein HK097_001809 [Rhizophlyctis rosea]|uniref:Uncharacterized protein n=1 Tax=Rhizophlyctis rosea TaxID=64517 RepID=A0AAD5S446_9FUNG|nr:hypothetical protein HK097_001809 [Rhizophlyctis rosea]